MKVTQSLKVKRTKLQFSKIRIIPLSPTNASRILLREIQKIAFVPQDKRI